MARAATAPVDVAALHDALLTNIERVIRGKRDQVRLALVCLFAEGHLLIEDVPGVGKTVLAKALAQSLATTAHRIQFTPDLLPSDVVGVSVWNQAKAEFEFRPGGVFAHQSLPAEGRFDHAKPASKGNPEFLDQVPISFAGLAILVEGRSTMAETEIRFAPQFADPADLANTGGVDG